MMISRRLALGLIALGACNAPGHAHQRQRQYCFTEARQGRLRGTRVGDVDSYRGIPYGGDVSGPYRFRSAPPPPPWSGIRDATRLGPPAIQPAGGMFGLNEPAPDENCLVLNVWTPRGGANRKPVMVYSHGGGFVSGSGGATIQDGAHLAFENDVVVVTTNHRLGLLGFLYLDHLAGAEYAGSGNRGVQDIAIALKWLAANVQSFRGDPDNVMVFGESGGGVKTSCLYAMPQASPYFHRASIESGPGIRILEPDDAMASTRRVLQHFELQESQWHRLLDIPASQLLAAQSVLGKPPNETPPAWGGRNGMPPGAVGTFAPVRDGHIMLQHPFDPVPPLISRHKPLLVGGNRDEQMFFAVAAMDTQAWALDKPALLARMTKAFGTNAAAVLAAYRSDRPTASPSDLYFAIQSDLFSGLGSTVIAERMAAQGGAPAYRYEFAFAQGGDVPGTSATMGAMHALDIPFKFNNMDTELPGHGVVAGHRQERYRVGRTMSRMWASFARAGIPSKAEEFSWPAYDLESRATMIIDVDCHVEFDRHRTERQFWEKFS